MPATDVSCGHGDTLGGPALWGWALWGWALRGWALRGWARQPLVARQAMMEPPATVAFLEENLCLC